MRKEKKIKRSYKQSPLGLIPCDWEVLELGEAVNIFVGRDLKENNFSSDKIENYRYPVYSNSVENLGFYGYYNFKEYTGESLTIVGRGVGLGTAFTRKGSYGAIGRLLVVFPKNGCVAHYITEYVNERVKVFTESSGIPQLTGEQIAKYKIALPPFLEQVAIANLLSKWDRAINLTTQLIAQKELRKKWLMQQLLTGKKRLRGYKEKWPFIKFGEIYTQIKEVAEDKKYLPLSVTKYGIISQAEYFNKEIQSEDTSPYLVVRRGNMVMSGLNFWMGAIDVLTEFENGIVSPAYKAFEIKNVNISPEFMKFFVRSELMLKALIASSVQGASIVRRNLDRETLEEWSFHLPNIKEQKAIAKVLQSADAELNLLRQKLDKLKEQKKGLMQVLLTGKKRLKLDKARKS